MVDRGICKLIHYVTKSTERTKNKRYVSDRSMAFTYLSGACQKVS